MVHTVSDSRLYAVRNLLRMMYHKCMWCLYMQPILRILIFSVEALNQQMSLCLDQYADIRARWLRFFESGNHENLPHVVVPSASLIADDPNLLLVNAGMVPFKPYFLGEVTPPYKRATSVQKCVRTLDIDEVGKTTRHASFFQMCGNFSFGDYFKEGAISLAWDLLTRSTSEGGYGFGEDRLWVTVTKMMMKLQIFGKRRLVFRKIVSSGVI